jgi:hypothetical protein
MRELVADTRLQAQLTHLRLVTSARIPVRHGWLKLVIKDLETNPRTQYKVHLWGAIYWLINFPAVTFIFFAMPAIWLKWGLYITLIYSVYANFSTDYSGMSASMAAEGIKPLPEIPLETK